MAETGRTRTEGYLYLLSATCVRIAAGVSSFFTANSEGVPPTAVRRGQNEKLAMK